MTPRARIDSDHTAFGLNTRVTRAPDARLAPLLHRGLYGFSLCQARFESWLEPPRPLVTLMVDLDGSILANGQTLPGAWLGGLDERPTVVGLDRGAYSSIDIQLTPLGAYTILGQPLSELNGHCVALEDLLGPGGRELAERLREASDWDVRFDILERFLLRRAADGPAPTPAVAWAHARIHQAGGNVGVEALAGELSCSRRYLTSRFTAEVGLPPKTAARQLRFARVCERLRRDPATIGEVALTAGYYDQAHLNRDFRELAGITPTAFLARLMPGGGVVGDGL